jgi:hypothetical protein
MALKGLWGSFFSHKDGHALTKRPTRFWSRIEVNIGQLLQPMTLDRHLLQKEVQDLLIR